LVPVIRGARVSGDPEIPRLAAPELMSIVVDDLREVTGYGGPARATLGFPGDVRDEDVEHLGGSDPIEEVEPEAALPLIEERLGQGLARAHALAQRRQGASERLLGLHAE